MRRHRRGAASASTVTGCSFKRSTKVQKPTQLWKKSPFWLEFSVLVKLSIQSTQSEGVLSPPCDGLNICFAACYTLERSTSPNTTQSFRKPSSSCKNGYASLCVNERWCLQKHWCLQVPKFPWSFQEKEEKESQILKCEYKAERSVSKVLAPGCLHDTTETGYT